MNYRPIQNDVLVKELEVVQGTIIIPDSVAKPCKKGIVVRTGPTCKHVQKGDIVQYAGVWSVDVQKWAGDGVFQIGEEHLLGIGADKVDWAKVRKSKET